MCLLSTFLHCATILILWYMIKNAFPAALYQSVVSDGAFPYCFSLNFSVLVILSTWSCPKSHRLQHCGEVERGREYEGQVTAAGCPEGVT